MPAGATENRTRIKLPECCKQRLQEIRRKQEAGALLQKALAGSPLAMLLGSGPIEMTFTVATTDWNLLARAVQSIPQIQRESCAKSASLEAVSHHNNAQLYRFWLKVRDTFRRPAPSSGNGPQH